MAKNRKIPPEVEAAHVQGKYSILSQIIVLIGVIVAAIIGGYFLLASSEKAKTTATETSKADATSVQRIFCDKIGDYSIRMILLKPLMELKGPASIHLAQGGQELGKLLNIEYITKWGISIASNKTVRIPEIIDLPGQGSVIPYGLVAYYESNNILNDCQKSYLEMLGTSRGWCGDGLCNNGEVCFTCPGDCGLCP